jgi:hypothetical protein
MSVGKLRIVPTDSHNVHVYFDCWQGPNVYRRLPLPPPSSILPAHFCNSTQTCFDYWQVPTSTTSRLPSYLLISAIAPKPASTTGKAPKKTKDNAPADGEKKTKKVRRKRTLHTFTTVSRFSEKKTKKVRRKRTLHIFTTVSRFICYLSTGISQDDGYS